MEEDSKYKTYKIVFNNKVIQLTYDMSFPEFKLQTIESLINEVLEKIGQKPLEKEPRDFNLHCSCGKILDQETFLSEPKCNHSCQEDTLKEKTKNEKYFLCEKDEEDEDIEKNDEKQLSKKEIDDIIKKVLESKKSKTVIKENFVKKPQKKNFSIPEGLKNKIKEYKIKKERGQNITDKEYSLFYNENYYKELISIGIDKNRAKGALRFSNNNKEEAALYSTDENFYWDNKEFLYYDNNDVIDKKQFEKLCIQEIKKEYPFIQSEEEINQRFKDIIELIEKKDKIENNDENEEDENDSSDD